MKTAILLLRIDGIVKGLKKKEASSGPQQKDDAEPAPTEGAAE